MAKLRIPLTIALLTGILLLSSHFKSEQPQAEHGPQTHSASKSSAPPRSRPLSDSQSAPGAVPALLKDRPSSEQQSLWTALARARREIHAIPASRAHLPQNTGYQLYTLSPDQNLTTRFGRQGVQVVSSDRTYREDDDLRPPTSWQAKLQLLKLAGRPVPTGALPAISRQSDTRVEYHHQTNLTEWYDNGAEGMEHGYTLAARPQGLAAESDVTLEISLDGLRAVDSQDHPAQSLSFLDGDREVLSYSKLLVIDAEGQKLPATMAATPSGFSLAYNDTLATYPVTIDPLIINEETQLNAETPDEIDRFGWSVAISGDTIVVGIPRDDDAGAFSGAAYVFTRNDSVWTKQDKLTAVDATPSLYLGVSVAISGDYAVIGSGSNSAYLFTRKGSTWTQQAKFTPDNDLASSDFGDAVGISDDTVIIGAGLDDQFGSNAGSAHIYTRSGTQWLKQTKLSPADASDGDGFGNSVAISGNTAIVGAERKDGEADYEGAAYVFVRDGSTWTQQQKLTSPTLDPADRRSEIFGQSVAISGETLAVGALSQFSEVNFTKSGAAFVFTRSEATWNLEAKLVPEVPEEIRFGGAVAISGDTLIAGATGGSGAAIPFTRSEGSWTRHPNITGNPSSGYGNSIAVSGDTLVVAAWTESEFATSAGRVYVYRLAASDVVELVAFDHLGAELTHGDQASAFPGQALGTTRDFSFSLSNSGTLPADIQSITLSGADADQFSLSLPDISTAADLTTNQDLDYLLSFQPNESGSGHRTATVTIVSNDSITPSQSFDITGLGLSQQDDQDTDEMNDWAEYQLRGFGFDWQSANPLRVADYYAAASAAGLYTEDELAAITLSPALLKVNPENNTADLVIQLQESSDLETFTPITIEAGKLSVSEEGDIRYQLEAPAGKKFIQATPKP